MKNIILLISVVVLCGCSDPSEIKEGVIDSLPDLDLSGEELTNYPSNIDEEIDDFFYSQTDDFNILNQFVYYPATIIDSMGVSQSKIDSSHILVGVHVVFNGSLEGWQFNFDLDGNMVWDMHDGETIYWNGKSL